MRAVSKTTCPYCGVGCGIEVHDVDGKISVRGDKSHPSNYGRLCSKGASLHETIDLKGRLLNPVVAGEQVDWDTALNKVAGDFQSIIKQYGPDAVAFYVSGQILTEDYYVANKLMKGFIGSANIDTNSRLCMSSSVAGHKRAFGSDTVPCSYEDLELAEFVVLTGTNAAWCHPVLYQRIVQAKKENPDFKVVVIDPRRTVTCDIADLHIPLAPGSDAVLFNGLLCYLSTNSKINDTFVERHTNGFKKTLEASSENAGSVERVAAATQCDVDVIETFYQWFAETEKTVTVYSQGINQSSSGTDKVNAILNCHLATGRIGRPGMGPFSFTGQPNAMGGREVGGLANQLAAHMEIDNPAHRKIVQDFWQSPRLCKRPGLKAIELFEAIDEGKVKAVWIMATNPVVSLPDADKVRRALEKCNLVVVSDCMQYTDTTAYADVLLPALTWGEKDGTVTNSERRISRQRQFLSSPGEAKADWWMLTELAKRMGYENHFDYKNPVDIFKEYARLTACENGGTRDLDLSGLKDIDSSSYNALKPTQWPVNAEHPTGVERMFSDGVFFTEDKKARFLSVIPRQPVNVIDSDFPLVLNTGRSRDQWHTMTRTGKSPRLAEHAPEPYAEICPQDATRYGITKNSLVKIFSRWGEVVVRTKISDRQRQGSVFVPIHWSLQFASSACIDAVVNPVTDPFSGQPEFKHTPVRITPYTPRWHGFLLSRRHLNINDTTYWAKANGDGYARYEIAGEQSPENWPTWARGILCSKDDDVNWVELLDKGASRYRGIRLVGNRVESCIFIAPGIDLPSRDWLASLFNKEILDGNERASLLTGKAPMGEQDAGPRVCACHGVGLNTVIAAIEQGANTVEKLGERTAAGTNCGSCIPELHQLIEKLS